MQRTSGDLLTEFSGRRSLLSMPQRQRGAFVLITFSCEPFLYDDVIKWKHFPRFWPFVRGIHRTPVNSPHKGDWRGPLMFSLICACINGWVHNREAGDLRRHRPHYDVTVMVCKLLSETIVAIMPTTIQAVIVENNVHVSGLGLSQGEMSRTTGVSQGAI